VHEFIRVRVLIVVLEEIAKIVAHSCHSEELRTEDSYEFGLIKFLGEHSS